MADKELNVPVAIDIDEAVHYIPFKAEGISGLIHNTDLPLLRAAYQIPNSIILRAPSTEDSACSFRENEVCLYEQAFHAGLRLPFPMIVRELLARLRLAL